MTRTIVTRNINAPVDLVFKTVARIENYKNAIPHIVEVEFLSDIRSGIGARFRETRLMKGKRASTELEVTQYRDNRYIRFVADSHGTIWDTLFEFKPAGQGTFLIMTMDATAYEFLQKIITRRIHGHYQNRGPY